MGLWCRPSHFYLSPIRVRWSLADCLGRRIGRTTVSVTHPRERVTHPREPPALESPVWPIRTLTTDTDSVLSDSGPLPLFSFLTRPLLLLLPRVVPSLGSNPSGSRSRSRVRGPRSDVLQDLSSERFPCPSDYPVTGTESLERDLRLFRETTYGHWRPLTLEVLRLP